MARHARSGVLPSLLSNGRAVVLLAACMAPNAFAEVAENEAHGFVSVHEVAIAAPPERVWEALVEEVGQWWDPAHTYSGDASNLDYVLLVAPGLWEEFREGHAEESYVRHMDIDMIRPPRTLRLRGGIGPLQPLAVVGSMTFNLQPAPESATEAPDEGASGTRLAYRYVVNGPRLRDWAEPVDRVMGEQLARLRRYVETGRPVAPAPDQSP